MDKLTSRQRREVARMIQEGTDWLHRRRDGVEFGTKNAQAERLLNAIDRVPHIFVLGCLMDRQITAERAWLIP